MSDAAIKAIAISSITFSTLEKQSFCVNPSNDKLYPGDSNFSKAVALFMPLDFITST
ncbi:MAG: hypothetical protein RMY29_018195 [Nostoc sp. CreGUA01]|nr:hypothetical protein [Nostoc sp. CreGUA01]